MKTVSARRAVVIEDYGVQVSEQDVLGLLREAGTAPGIHARATIQVGVSDGGEATVLESQTLMELARAKNPEIPADAELVLAIRWRREVPAGAPVNGLVMPGVALGAPAVPQAGLPSQGAPCGTCGGSPWAEGPTPGCQDTTGCSEVRKRRGELPVIPTAEPVVAGQAPRAPGEGPGRPTGIVTNSVTGKKAFMGAGGVPYGHHEYEEK